MSNEKPIAPWQIKRIRTLFSALGLNEDAYRSALAEFIVAGNPATSCKQLSYVQANAWIDRLQATAEKAGRWKPKPRVKWNAEAPRATPEMLSRLRFHSLFCAVHYADLGSYTLESGVTLTGEALRVWLRDRFTVAGRDGVQLKATPPIPPSVLRAMYSGWINPTTHRFLVEGNYKTKVVRPERFFYHDLPREWAQYLIDRYREMQTQIEIEYAKMSVPLTQTIPETYNDVSKN